jgi:hypothetical protein
MRLVALLLALAFLARPTDVDACSISAQPSAHIFQPPSGKPTGHRPFISLWRTTKPVNVTRVSANCIEKTICKGAAVAVERVGSFLRPKAALPDGARIQVTHDGKLLADATIVKAPAAPLPAWDGISFVSAKHEKEGLCSPAGPVVRLAVKPTKASLEHAVLLVYTSKPDPKRPLEGLRTIFGLGAGNGQLEIGNGYAQPDLFKDVPKQIFVMLADGDGNVGPVITLP